MQILFQTARLFLLPSAGLLHVGELRAQAVSYGARGELRAADEARGPWELDVQLQGPPDTAYAHAHRLRLHFQRG